MTTLRLYSRILAATSALLIGWVPLSPASEEQAVEERSSFLDKFEIHGFGSLGFLNSTKNNYLTESMGGAFDFNEAALNFGMELRDDLRVGAQVFIGDLGEYGNYEPRLDWGYLDWRPKNWLGFRGGKFKRASGLYNETLDVDAARTWALLPQGVYNFAHRDFLLAVVGVGAYGNIDLGSGGDVDYQVYYGRGGGNSSTTSASERMGSGSGFTTTGKDRFFVPGFALVWNTPLDGLRTGLTQAPLEQSTHVAVSPFLQSMGLPATTDIVLDIKKYVASAEYSVSRFVFAGEYSWTIGSISSQFFEAHPSEEEYYVSGTFRINDLFELGSYYSLNYQDKNDKQGLEFDPFYSAFQKDLALCLRIDPIRFLILKLEYHRVDGTGSLLNELNLDGVEQKWSYLASKITFAF
jgi:hypothetical protein